MTHKITLGMRIVLGLIFFVFGLNGFLHFIPTPPMTPEAGEFAVAMMKTGYFFPLLKIFEVACGALLLSGFWIPLALTMLAPIAINIFFFHLFLDTQGLLMAVIVIALEIGLAWMYRDHFKGVLVKKATLGKKKSR